MTDIDAGAAAPEETADAPPGIRILAQFVRDLSFENPRRKACAAARPSRRSISASR
jgi:preprotein translocase subunit SecB